MNDVVLDASAALGLLLPSQATGAGAAFLLAAEAERFIAPYVFAWEVGNVLVRLRLRGLLAGEAYHEAFDHLSALEVAMSPAPTPDAVVALGDLAAAEGIRLFDAAYLALAVDRRCPLASRDALLLEVARRYVPTYDLRGDHLP